MKRFIATLALLAGLTHAAPITMLDVPDNTALYDSSDPFAIGVSTAAYTSATNANARLDALMLGNAATVTNIATYVTAQHANRTDNPHSVTAAQVGAATAVQGTKADTAIQPATLATHTNLTLANGAHGGEADTLATVAARGGFAGTETINPLVVNAGRYGTGAGVGSSGASWSAFGVGAGSQSSGDSWCAFGVGAGSYTVGNGWGAYGRASGVLAIHTNSSSIGSWAGWNARGNTRLYVDTYSASPDYAAGGATNDMIFGDNGQLNLGRTGALTNALPNQLRGRWKGKIDLASGTTVEQATAGNEPVSLDQALSLLSSSSTIYLSPAVFAGATAGVTNRSLSASYSPSAWKVVYNGAVTAGQYIFSYTAPSNLVTSILAGNQTAHLYMTYAGGGGSTLTCKMEGYIFDPATTSSVDYAETSASFAPAKSATLPTTPFMPIAVIPVATNLTGDLRYQIRIKAITASSVTSVTMWGGSNSISSVSLPVSDSVVLGARGATAIKSAEGVSGTYDSATRTLTMPSVGVSFTNGTTMADGVLNGTNGFFFVPLGSTNRYWILGGQ